MRKSMQNLAGSRSPLVGGVDELILFYKIRNNLTLLYTKEPIPPTQHVHHSLRSQNAIGRLEGRTEEFQSSFYLNCILE